jgi:hypothetical protein
MGYGGPGRRSARCSPVRLWGGFPHAASIKNIGGRNHYFRFIANQNATWARERCHGHGMVGIRSNSGKPHPRPLVPSIVSLTHRPMARSFLLPSRWLHVYRAGQRRRAACARPLAGASLSMTPPDLVPQIRASHYHAKVTNDIRFNRVIGECEPDALDDRMVSVSDTKQRRVVSRSLLTEGLSSTNMSGPFVAHLEHYESTHLSSLVSSSKKTCRKALSAPPFCRGIRRVSAKESLQFAPGHLL